MGTWRSTLTAKSASVQSFGRSSGLTPRAFLDAGNGRSDSYRSIDLIRRNLASTEWPDGYGRPGGGAILGYTLRRRPRAPVQFDRRTTATRAQMTPHPCCSVIDSCKKNPARGITTRGYRAVSGATIDALPPLFRAANKAHAPSAFKVPLISPQARFHRE